MDQCLAPVASELDWTLGLLIELGLTVWALVGFGIMEVIFKLFVS